MIYTENFHNPITNIDPKKKLLQSTSHQRHSNAPHNQRDTRTATCQNHKSTSPIHNRRTPSPQTDLQPLNRSYIKHEQCQSARCDFPDRLPIWVALPPTTHPRCKTTHLYESRSVCIWGWDVQLVQSNERVFYLRNFAAASDKVGKSGRKTREVGSIGRLC